MDRGTAQSASSSSLHTNITRILLRPVVFISCLLSVVGVGAQTTPDAVDFLAYERGDLGAYPQVKFKTTDFTAPVVHVTQWSDECLDGYVLLSPGGQKMQVNRALLLDAEGQLVYHHRERGAIKNLQVQQYKGKNYLTYWVGDAGFFGHGNGYYKMLDESYALAYTISASHHLAGDYHEFTITRENTALITVWAKIPWDLTKFGRQNGYIWNYIFQEIDIETNQLIKAWSAVDSFSFADMNVNSWTSWTGTEEDPWDWFHMNSVDKDSKGNYLISARYTNGVSYIDGETMQPIWHLGGRNNTFVELSGGNATRFVDPHMARWTDESHTTVSVFDNIAFWSYSRAQRQSQGTHVLINVNRGFSKLAGEFQHPELIFAKSEGSMQQLDNGNYFVGYGSTAVYSEFSPNGTMLCNAHYAPLYSGSKGGLPNPGPVRSYRSYKARWIGHPEDPPSVKIDGGTIYVSWNGATELKGWKLDARAPADHFWKPIGVFAKGGFETTIDIPMDDSSAFQLTALDGNERAMRSWHVRYDGALTELYQDAVTHERRLSAQLPALLVILICLGLLITVNRRFFLRGL